MQPIVSFLTIEAEYIAITEGVKEALWLKGLIIEMGYEKRCVTWQSKLNSFDKESSSS